METSNSNILSNKTFHLDVYADGPTLDEITVLDQNLIKGYTFNPTLFRMLKVTDYLSHCKLVVSACGDVPVSLEVIADDAEGMVHQARILGDLGSNVHVKIPITFTSGKSTIHVIETLVKDGLKLNITAIFSKAQVQIILPVLQDAGAIVSVFAGRIFDIGVDAVEITREIAEIVHAESNCKVLWASPRMVYDFKNASNANCDIITMVPSLIKKLSMFGMKPEDHSLNTVKMFFNDAVSSGYKI
jgi:transaldolase